MTETRTCACGREFLVTDEDRTRCEARGWEVPKKCHPCRFDRRRLRGGTYHQLGGEFGAQRQEA